MNILYKLTTTVLSFVVKISIYFEKNIEINYAIYIQKLSEKISRVFSRVSQSEAENKMSLGNLATVFGPNLLRPPPKEKTNETSSTSESIAREMASGTLNVMSQSSIFYWFLRSKSDKIRLPTTPEITRRLFPSKKEVVKPRLSSQSEDKLI
jgi:L-2-hydroxyglutarate oxidase LhgO